MTPISETQRARFYIYKKPKKIAKRLYVYELIWWRTRKFCTTKKIVMKNAKKRHKKSKRSNIKYILTIYFMTETTKKCTNFVDTLSVLHFSIIFSYNSDFNI